MIRRIRSVPGPIPPVNPDASPEAKALLDFLYSVPGSAILTGQHCVPLVGSSRLAGVHKLAGRYPAVFGQDFGFSAAGTWDGINYRQQIVDEAIRRHTEGFIITLMWHAARPVEDEPVEFEKSVQGRLSDREWRKLITPGTELHERWKSQVDVIAWFLKQLRTAGVPVLWRPYHEMNGDWFWWGKRSGEGGYTALYRMMYDRFTHFHGLNNLLWVFNANEIRPMVGAYRDYYPGHDRVDVLATDVYSNKFTSNDYDRLSALAEGRPIGLGEVGNLPRAALLRRQPRWVWFMYWHDPYQLWTDRKTVRDLYNSGSAVTLEDLPWIQHRDPSIHYPILK